MKNIFISGGALNGFTNDIDNIYEQIIEKKKPLLYIGTAKKNANYNKYFERLKTVFTSIDKNKFTMWIDLKDKKIGDLEYFSSIYIGGGNTFYLLKHLKESGFDKVLTNYINNGGIVFGESAGAIILGKTIKTCSYVDKNHFGLKELNGLDLLNGFSIACHYKQVHKKILENIKQNEKTNIIALEDGKGLNVSLCEFKYKNSDFLNTNTIL